MDKTELKKELDQMLEQMPASLVREILDFAEFLLTKRDAASSDETSENNALSVAETQHLEEEFANYKALYPKKNQNG